MYNLFLFLFLFFQTHPNIDKKVFSQGSVLALKQPNKPFPLNSDIGVLRWRMQTTDEALMPLSSKLLVKKKYLFHLYEGFVVITMLKQKLILFFFLLNCYLCLGPLSSIADLYYCFVVLFVSFSLSSSASTS